MAVVQKTYAELGELWGVSKEAARKKVEGLRLPRKPGNDGKTRVTIDLSEVSHTPMRHRAETDGRPDGDQPETDPGDLPEDDRRPTPVVALHGQIAALEAAMADLRGNLDQARADRDQERVERLAERVRTDEANARADKITAELHDLAQRFAGSIEDARARESTIADKLDAARAEMAALRSRPWWRRLAG